MKIAVSKSVLVGLAILVSGCSSPSPTRVAKARYTTYIVPHSGLTPQERAWVDKNCPFGEPILSSPEDIGATQIIARNGYVLEHSATDKTSLWVCEWVQKSDINGSGNRNKSNFAPDPSLPVGSRAELEDYARSGYDRGHQAPAADHTSSQRETDETFYLSNMAPQKPALNRDIWANLESKVRNIVKKEGAAYVITGGLFYDPKEDSPATADGLVEYKTIGKDAVSVPTHFYKIIVYEDDGNWKATAYVLENRKYGQSESLDQQIRTIDWVEERAGIDFMPKLSDLEERDLESRKGTPL